jgi:hypothetical protein
MFRTVIANHKNDCGGTAVRDGICPEDRVKPKSETCTVQYGLSVVRYEELSITCGQD